MQGTVYCVEPMPNNVDLLRAVAKKTDIPAANFHIVQAAMALAQDPPQVPFPNGEVGQEDYGIGNGTATYPLVSTSTVDVMFGHLPRIDYLLVDTEGHDPHVLMGSAHSSKGQLCGV